MSVDLKKSLLIEVAAPRPAEGETPAKGPTLRINLAKNGYSKLENATTLFELWQRSVTMFGEKQCLGWRPIQDGKPQPFTWMTYKQAAAKVTDIASGLKAIGVPVKGRVGVFGANSPEWMITMQACNRTSAYCVPLYDSLGENAIEFIIHHSEATVVFVASDKAANLAKALPLVQGQVKTVVCWGAKDAGAVKAIEGQGIKVYSFEEFAALGASKPAEPSPPSPDDYCTIMYTSGTTGDPKGVLLTHRAVVATVAAQLEYLGLVGSTMGGGLGPNDVMLSYLPLAHIFDRAAEETFLSLGASIGYWRGDIKGLIDDISALRPTLFIGVPRVFDRIYTAVMGKVKADGGLKAFLFNWGFSRKLYHLEEGRSYKNASPFFDMLVFSKVKERLGGRVRLIITGGAPLARHVEDFLKVAMCCPVVQGYGLTETCAASFICTPDIHTQAGSVGVPMPCLEFCLEGVPEMKYDPAGTPPRGEVCLRGDSLFSGYYKQEDKTAEVVDADGWFHSGDVGELTPAGTLKIIDRKKNIFKLSQGAGADEEVPLLVPLTLPMDSTIKAAGAASILVCEYVAVEKVEAVYKKNPLVEQIWVYGNSFESVLVAVVVPEETKLKSWAAANGVSGGPEEICADPKAAAYYLEQLTVTAKEGKLKGFELVKTLHLDAHQFTVENELMTPTFKLKRPQLQKHYQAVIDSLYTKWNSKS